MSNKWILFILILLVLIPTVFAKDFIIHNESDSTDVYLVANGSDTNV